MGWCQYAGNERQCDKWILILLSTHINPPWHKSVPQDQTENLLLSKGFSYFVCTQNYSKVGHRVMCVAKGCTAHVGNNSAISNMGSGKVKQSNRVKI